MHIIHTHTHNIRFCPRGARSEDNACAAYLYVFKRSRDERFGRKSCAAPTGRPGEARALCTENYTVRSRGRTRGAGTRSFSRTLRLEHRCAGRSVVIIITALRGALPEFFFFSSSTGRRGVTVWRGASTIALYTYTRWCVCLLLVYNYYHYYYYYDYYCCCSYTITTVRVRVLYVRSADAGNGNDDSSSSSSVVRLVLFIITGTSCRQ